LGITTQTNRLRLHVQVQLFRAARNMEVVVSVHVARTTTSEQAHLGVITNPKPELITTEKEHASNVHNRSCCGRPTLVNNNFQTATAPLTHNILLVDVTGNTRMTTSTQLLAKL
jgi:hypothetical protein